jgi:hypothetical protein
MNIQCGLVVRFPGYISRVTGFNLRHYQIFVDVVGLEQGAVSLLSTTEELLQSKSSGFGLEIRKYGHRVPLC